MYPGLLIYSADAGESQLWNLIDLLPLQFN